VARLVLLGVVLGVAGTLLRIKVMAANPPPPPPHTHSHTHSHKKKKKSCDVNE
jgi:hypothetical protein